VIHRRAKVLSSDERYLTLKTNNSHCGSCAVGCHKGHDRPLVMDKHHLSALPLSLTAGSAVRLSFPPGLLLGLSFSIYLLPVLVMLLFIACVGYLLPGNTGIGNAGNGSEGAVIIAAIAGMASGLAGSAALVRYLESKAKKSLVCDSL